ncbi:MAG: NAD(P)-dependent oxidoreductase [Solirubrobacterales bacterium]
MKIFVAGAAGAIGNYLTPLLVQAGHDVVGTSRTASGLQRIKNLGADALLMDGLDRKSVSDAVTAASPDLIINQMTALSGGINPRRIEKSFSATNRLRAEGTDNLLAAAAAAGTRRFIAQSYTGWPYARTGGPVKTETDPLDPDPPPALRPLLDAIRHLEDTVIAAGGMVLRYGGFYGPGTGMAPGGEQWEMIKSRRMPIIGDGEGIWSFIQIEDAAKATKLAVDSYRAGEVFNIVDDDPAPVKVWLPVAAESIGAKTPHRVPRWVGKLAAGEQTAVMMCEIRGASNEKAKRDLGWTPTHPSWREGIAGMA